MNANLTNILLAVAFVGLIAGGFIFFFAEGATIYGATDMDNSKLNAINGTLTSLNQNAENTRSAMSALQGLPLGLDILGGIFVGAYTAIVTVTGSVDLIFAIFGVASTTIPFGSMTNLFLLFGGVALLIIVFVNILGNYVGKGNNL